MKKIILILVPIWRNRNIFNFLSKRYTVHITDSKINDSFVKLNKIDFLVTSGYAFLIKKKIISAVKKAINLHISFLPYGRGIMPNLWSFYEGYPSGITIHELDESFDTGKIIIQKKIKFTNIKKQTLKTTHDFLLLKLEDFFLKNADKIFLNKIKSYKQDKYIKIDKYHTRVESNKLMKNFKKRWNTKISTVIKYAKKN